MSNSQASIVCLGHNENALLFNASGIEGVIIESEQQFYEEVNKFIDKGIKIFLVSDEFNNYVNKLREEHVSVYPIFLSLNLNGDVSVDGVESIRKDVERATGINLF